MRKERCPAWKKTCSKCGKSNHFAKMCMQKGDKKVHTIAADSDTQTSDEDYDDYLFGVGSHISNANKIIKAKMKIDDKTVTVQVDSGASVNVITQKHTDRDNIVESRTKLHTYDGTVITPVGKTILNLTNPKTKKTFKTEFQVVKEDLIPLVGKQTSERMGLITVNYENFESAHVVKTSKVIFIQQLLHLR